MSHVCSTDVAHGRHHERVITLQCFCSGNESRRTYEWVTSHSCMGCVLHVCRCDRRISQPFFCLGSESYKRVISYIWISRVAYMWMNRTIQMKKSCRTSRTLYLYCHTDVWGMWHIAHINESCHTYKWVMSHRWMSHVAQRERRILIPYCYNDTHVRRCDRRISHPFFCLGSESYKRVTSHIWMSRVAHVWMHHMTHMNEPCRTYKWVMSHRWMSHVAYCERRILLPYYCLGNMSYRTY